MVIRVVVVEVTITMLQRTSRSQLMMNITTGEHALARLTDYNKHQMCSSEWCVHSSSARRRSRPRCKSEQLRRACSWDPDPPLQRATHDRMHADADLGTLDLEELLDILARHVTRNVLQLQLHLNDSARTIQKSYLPSTAPLCERLACPPPLSADSRAPYPSHDSSVRTPPPIGRRPHNRRHHSNPIERSQEQFQALRHSVL